MLSKIKTVKLLLSILLFNTPMFSQDVSKPLAIGVVEKLPSKLLNEHRILNIYLPEGYDRDDTTKYEVAYLLDGSIDEDFIHVVGLYQFNTFEWINRVPKTIVVGIATVDRKRDFTFQTTIVSDKKKYTTTGHSDKFIAFIQNELQPFIEKKYRTNNTKTLIGQSLGGLLAAEILLTNPRMFNNYIIISPSLWWSDGALLKKSIAKLNDKNLPHTKVYIGVGKEGLTPTEQPRVMEVDANLLADKIIAVKNNNIEVFFDYLPNENHATIAHQAIFNALRLLYPINKQ